MPLPYDFASAVRALSNADPRMALLIQAVGHVPVHYRKMDNLFAALCESIAYQQLSGKAARTIFSRFEALLPENPGLHPESVLSLTIEEMRSAGLSRAKTVAIRDLAEKMLDNTVPVLSILETLPDDSVIDCLTKVKGIGPWTAEMLLIFRLGRPDVLPASDLGIRKGFQLVYEHAELPSPSEVLAFGTRWKPYRSVAAWYLYRALEMDTPLASREI